MTHLGEVAAPGLLAPFMAAGHASVVVNIDETFSDLLASSSGLIDTHGLIFGGNAPSSPEGCVSYPVRQRPLREM